MKTARITYWFTTCIVALMMVYSAYAYLTNTAMQQAFTHLGYPQYFRVQLALAKIIGAVLLLVPVGARLKEWVYAGFAFTFISAFIAHTSAGDPVNYRVMPLVFLAVLTVSYITYHRFKNVAANSLAPKPAL
jgi:hypothetical protein